MRILKKRTSFPHAAELLAAEGFTDNYIEVLREELKTAEHPKDIARGQNFLANALLIRGRLTEAFTAFQEIDLKNLERHLHGNLISNMIFCQFVQNHFKAAEELYQTYNAAVLGERTEAMKRSLAIHEHIQGRYEVAVEILVKMGDSSCRFIDICMVKSLLRLDMFSQAADYALKFGEYKNCNELSKEVGKLKKKIQAKINSEI